MRTYVFVCVCVFTAYVYHTVHTSGFNMATLTGLLILWGRHQVSLEVDLCRDVNS